MQMDLDEEDIEILKIIQTYPMIPAKVHQSSPDCSFSQTQNISDAVLIMLAKEIEYVEALTGLKSGFIFQEAKGFSTTDFVTDQMIPKEYKQLWSIIRKCSSLKCKNLLRFFNKMLASKNTCIAREFLSLYFQCLEHILQMEATKRPDCYQQIMENSKAFGRCIIKYIITQSPNHKPLKLNPEYINICLANTNHSIRQLYQFQIKFDTMYSQFKKQLCHLLQVTYVCIAMEFYNLEANHLYEGYFANTELDTTMGQPKQA